MLNERSDNESWPGATILRPEPGKPAKATVSSTLGTFGGHSVTITTRAPCPAGPESVNAFETAGLRNL